MKDTTRKAWLIRMVIAAVFAMLFIFLSLFLHFYHDIYNLPKNNGGIMDATGYDMAAHNLDAVLDGEWEFFHNKWIVTDGLEDEPDTMLKMPGYWTDQGFSRHAYASYRIFVINLPPGTKIRMTMSSCPIGYRTFINGKLCTVSGTVSKDENESFARPHPQTKNGITVPESGVAEIVLELAANSQGGLVSILAVKQVRENLSQSLYNDIAYIVLGIMFAVILFDLILNLGFVKKQRQLPSVLLLLAVVLHFLTSKEIYLQSGIYLRAVDYGIILDLNFITGIIMLAVFILRLLLTGQMTLNRRSIIALSAVAAAGVAGYFLLAGYSWRLLPVFISLAAFGCVFWKLSAGLAQKHKFSGTNIIILFLMLGMLVLEALDNLGFVFVLMETAVSIIMILLVLVFGVQSFLRIRSSAVGELRALRLETEINKIRQEAYKAQVNPHFVFNVLSSIEDAYKMDAKRGEMALEQFAAHLRQHINAGNRDLIPFEAELENILNYIELENLRRETPLEVLFDIDYQEFSVPTLSLQPLIENSIRHSGIIKKQDGILRIISEKCGDGSVRITVSDNGNGFVPEKIRENATGLKNTAERFKLLLNAGMKIESRIGMGTDIIIDIPVHIKQITGQGQI